MNHINKYRQFLLLLLFVSIGTVLSAQNIQVTGTVTDKLGPMAGVNIVLKGTQTGTMTDMDGKYSIQVPATGVLEFTFLGYNTQTVNVNSRKIIHVSMEESSQALDEVVVVGYGSMKKRDITGSIVSVSDKDIQSNEPVNIASALQGKVSGLDIMSTSEPGTAATFRIRGTSTLSDGGSNPLFIVDGMEVSNIDNINPRDIASVEVLKDAASAAIYGSRSAKGVVIISTKQGQEGKAKVSANYSLKQSRIGKKLAQMSRLQGIQYETLRNFLNGNYTTIANRDSLNPSMTADNFYQDLLFRHAWTNQVDVSVSGAEKKLKYFVSAGYLGEQGIQVNTFNKRLTTRINADYNATPRLTIGNRLALTISNQRRSTSESRSRLLQRPANYNVIEPDGSYTPILASRSNPLAESMVGKNNYKIYNLDLYEFLEYKILDELKFKASIAGSINLQKYQSFRPAILDVNGRRKSTNQDDTKTSWTHEDVLTYNKTFNKDHALTVLGGFSLQEFKTEMTKLAVVDNISDAIEISNAYGGVDMTNTKATWTANRLASFFGRISYSYKGKYLFNSNLRYDGSSRFGTDKRWGFFPSASLGWRFSDEVFMKWMKPVVSDSKLRLSYGVTGNQVAGNFSSLGLYTTNFYADMPGIYPNQLENRNLGWEQTQQYNIGLDVSVLDGRIGLIADYYNKKTSDVLYQVKLPQTSGFSSSYQNIGDVKNTGWEITVNSTNIKTKDFHWNTSLNLSFNKNTIVSIPEGGQQFINTVYILDKGYAVGTMYGWKANAIFPYDESNAFTPDWKQLTPIFDEKDRFTGYELDGKAYDGEIKQYRYNTATGDVFKGGDVMWDDVNKDGIIDAKDRQVLGCGQPDVIGGFNNDFTYKGFTLSLFFSFAIGGDVFNAYEQSRSEHKWSAITRGNPANIANSWKAPGDIAKFPKPNGAAVMDNTRFASSLWIEDGSYIRLKNIRLAYELPKNIVKKIGVESLSVSAMMQNFFTWSNYSGFDPELPSSGFAVGYDNNSYPKAKDILFGVNVNF